MPKNGDPHTERAVRRIWHWNDRAIDRLTKAGRREYGDPGLEEALAKFGTAIGLFEQPAAELQLPDDDPRLAVFVPWFLFHWVPDDAPVDDDWPSEHTIAGRFLQSRGQRGKFLERFVDAVRREPFTFWEVVDAEPGAGMRLRDLVLDREVWVHALKASADVRPWTIIFGQVVEIDDVAVLLASLPIGFPPHIRELVERGTSSFLDRPLQDKTELLEYDFEMLTIMGLAVDQLYQAAKRRPILQNTDGDALVWTTSRYTFDPGSRDEVTQCVASIPDMEEQEQTEEGEAEFVLVVDQPGNRMMPNVHKGTVLVGDGTLTTECNSVERDAVLRQMLEGACGGRLSYESTERQEIDLEQLQGERQPTPQPRGAIPPELEAKLSPGERAALMGALRDKFLAWADEEVPALGNQTPRQAVKTAKGRKKVIELIKGWEHMCGRPEEREEWQDFEALRQTLGLTGEQ